MAATLPYTCISCPCSTVAEPAPRRASYIDDQEPDVEDEFNPHNARSNYSLYPYSHLLYCDECQQIRCPKCWTDEITAWYCPSCLFEVPSSVVKSDGNRCTRNCYNCPLCTSPLSINALDQQSTGSQDVSGPYFLSCPYCDWSSLDAGIELSKPNKVTEQLTALRKERSGLGSIETAFSNLAKFYKDQISASDTDSSTNAFGDSSYSSPGHLARIMQQYGGISSAALKKAQQRPQPMREALSASEGLLITASQTDEAIIDRLAKGDAPTSTSIQRSSHPWNCSARFISDLWPVPALLRTKTDKRCRACRHILIRHDDRKGSSKYKIRLLAQNHIPRLSLRPMSVPSSAPSAAFALTPAALKANADALEWNVTAHKPVQYILTLTNPLFESVKVTLATPSITPGRIQSRVTILCPSLNIGADGDMWDEALGTSSKPSSSSRQALETTAGTDDRQPEAGKIWEKGRNWTSVIVEVVPGPLQASMTEDILEIPILVRVDWEAEVAAEGGGSGGRAGRESRQVTFWSVTGAGQIRR